VSAAVGGEVRSESFQYTSSFFNGLADLSGQQLKRTVRSAFTEVTVPIVGASNEFAGARRIEFVTCWPIGRLFDFGSHVDPKVGIMWQPFEGLRIRSSFGTSFKAPSLYDYSTAGNATIAEAGQPDPVAPSAFRINYSYTAAIHPLSPLRNQKNFSFGSDWTPNSVPGVKLSLNYFDINYRDQIATPPTSSAVILGAATAYGGLITRNPTVAEVNQGIAYGVLGQGF